MPKYEDLLAAEHNMMLSLITDTPNIEMWGKTHEGSQQVNYTTDGLRSFNRTYAQMFAAAREGIYEPSLLERVCSPGALAEVFDWYVTTEFKRIVLSLGLIDEENDARIEAITNLPVEIVGYNQHYTYEIASTGGVILDAFIDNLQRHAIGYDTQRINGEEVEYERLPDVLGAIVRNGAEEAEEVF